MTVRPGTQAYAVFDAVRQGWMNAPDIADETGLGKATVSAWLFKLTEGGLVKRTHSEWGSFHRRGRRFHRYAPVDEGALRMFPSGAIRARQ